MNMLIKSGEEGLARRLEEDPGHFEPSTAFRVAQHLSGPDALEVHAHLGIQPTPLPVSGFRRKAGRNLLKSAFAAIVGPLGSLPPEYNELLLREERNRSRALNQFFNLFSSRFAALFVAATEKYRMPRRLRWSTTPDENTFRRVLLSLAGFGTARLVERSGVDEDTLLRFSGLFADRTRNASGLKAMLSEFSGLPVEIEMFRPRWVSIAAEELSQMGAGKGPRLGVNAMAGTAVQDLSGGLRIVLGPVGFDDYLSLSPGKPRLVELFALTRLFVGNGFAIDAQVILAKEEIPLCQMGNPETPARLGWNSWARIAPAREDSRDAIVTEAQAQRATVPSTGLGVLSAGGAA